VLGDLRTINFLKVFKGRWFDDIEYGDDLMVVKKTEGEQKRKN
jgi:hypothetical protein